MQLESLTIENFKSVGSPVTVHFGKITLLFGENSCGKSTILQALHLMDEVLNERSNSPNRTRMGGDFIRLGGFEKFVHKRDLSKTVKLTANFRVKANEFELSEPDEVYRFLSCPEPLGTIISDYYREWSEFTERPCEPVEGSFFGALYFREKLTSISVAIEICADKRVNNDQTIKSGRPILSKIKIKINDRLLLVFALQSVADESGNTKLAEVGYFNIDHPALPSTIFDWGHWQGPETSVEITENVRRFLLDTEETRSDSHKDEPYDIEVEPEPHLRLTTEERWNRLATGVDSASTPNWTDALRVSWLDHRNFVCWRRDFDVESGLKIQDLMSYSNVLSLQIGECFYYFSEEHPAGPMPEDAFSIVSAYTSITLFHVMTAARAWLERSIHVGPLRSHCDPSPLWNHEDLKDQDCSAYGDWYDGTKAWYTLAGQQSGNLAKWVNAWMQNQFGFRLRAEPMRETLRRELEAQLTVNLDDTDLDVVLRSMNRNSTLGVITLCTEDGVTVTSRDVGVGYSQLLPVVTAAFITERKSNLNGIRIFEQPELHIHAKLQATLADLLIQKSEQFDLEDYNVPQFLLETHSEYLLLRLMRRIRETKKGINPTGPKLSSEDVVLHRVWMEDGETRVSEMPLDEFGNLTVEWPDNLLEISYRETFGK